MSQPIAFTFDGLPVSPWRNGGGETREIFCCQDAGAMAGGGRQPEFDWRASIATIDRNGDFSAFPGIDRIIALLEGDGVRLNHASGRFVDLTTPGAPYSFDGEASISAVLAGGPSRDFNIMVRRSDWQARLTRLTRPSQAPAGHDGVFYVLAGRWRIRQTTLSARQGLWWRQLDTPMDLTPVAENSLALWAQISPRALTE